MHSAPTLNELVFVNLLEHSKPGHAFAITTDIIIRSKVNELLRKLASNVDGKYKSFVGRKRKQLESRTKLFHILKGQTVSIDDHKNENQLLHDQLEEWRMASENF